ncbi:Crp/Fnr family transcriptional regulator [uncultured Kordia sp.]|uniref:Crp/Fnr family transcriptional regulator n=1 Tax=uncultured Kordia sp. TaxID=507699 RepID=UPI00260FE3AD|nr:Crp/Fnr family transcriptional regulator [uncultured Kordia sp.]
MQTIQQQLAFLEPELVSEIITTSSIQKFSKGTQILREAQYIKVLPVVLEGSVKVFSRFNEKELLLYYIQPVQSCVMSFSSCLNQQPSKVFAITEEDSKILLIPATNISIWLKSYPKFNALFYQQYDLRYSELLDTIQHVLINRMDKRLYDYLLQKSKVTQQQSFKITHGEIANELGTAREVISRVMKKLEAEGKISQTSDGIKIHSL